MKMARGASAADVTPSEIRREEGKKKKRYSHAKLLSLCQSFKRRGGVRKCMLA